jgi:hypothetical protein
MSRNDRLFAVWDNLDRQTTSNPFGGCFTNIGNPNRYLCGLTNDKQGESVSSRIVSGGLGTSKFKLEPRTLIHTQRFGLLCQLSPQYGELVGGGNTGVGRVFSSLYRGPIHESSLGVHFQPLVVDKASRNDRSQKREKSKEKAEPPERYGSSFESAGFINDTNKQWLWGGVWFSGGLWLCWWCGKFTLGGNWFDWIDRLYRRLSGHRFSDRERVLISAACFLGGLVLCSHAIINCRIRSTLEANLNA